MLEGSALFDGANTAAQLLVLEKSEQARRVHFVFEHDEPEAGFRRVVFTESPERLRQGFDGRRTLWQLGYEAVTGTVVWNQRRADLRTRPGRARCRWSGPVTCAGGPSTPQGRSGDGGPGLSPEKPGLHRAASAG